MGVGAPLSSKSMIRVGRQLFVLAKPRIVAMLAFTAVCGMWKAAGGPPPWVLTMGVVVAGAVAAAGCNAVNQALEADVDAVMGRTRWRPVASGQLGGSGVLWTGLAAVGAAVVGMGLLANWLSAGLTAAAAGIYVLLYTLLLKRRSWNNIVLGGAAGALPPLIGSVAVLGRIEPMGLFMFTLIFFWTPPHFWTLALLVQGEYSAAKIPMLPVVVGARKTLYQVMLYIVLLTALAWLSVAAGVSGLLFGSLATLLGLEWLRRTWKLRGDPDRRQLFLAYRFSLIYLAVLFLVLAIEESLA